MGTESREGYRSPVPEKGRRAVVVPSILHWQGLPVAPAVNQRQLCPRSTGRGWCGTGRGGKDEISFWQNQKQHECGVGGERGGEKGAALRPARRAGGAAPPGRRAAGAGAPAAAGGGADRGR